MAKEESKDCCRSWKDKHHHHGGGGPAGGSGGAIFFFGFVGAAFYFCQNLTGMDFAIGILKAFVWPAFLIHKVFTMLGI